MQTSDIRHQTSDIRHQTSDIRQIRLRFLLRKKHYSIRQHALFFLLSSMLISSAIQAQNLSIELVPATYTANYHISCNGAADGSITANHENTNPPFTYLWSTGATTKSVSGLQAGSYSVTITDANSHTGTGHITLTQPNVLGSERVRSEYGTYQIPIHGGNNGSISVTPTGGTASYTILWNDNDNKFNRNGLSAGAYSYVITDANGCTAQGSSTLTQPDPLQLSFSNVTGVSCNGFEDGSAQLTITGGIAPYQILWDNGSFVNNPDNLPAGLREVNVTDAFSKKETGQVNIPEPAPISVELVSPLYPNSNHVSCYDCYNGSITANVTGGTGTYAYHWKEIPGANTATVNGLNGGHYKLSVTDQHGCTVTNEIGLKMPQRDDWSMTGNTGTDANTQFIGTTDSVDVVFKRNNFEKLRLNQNGVNLSGNLNFENQLGIKSFLMPDGTKSLRFGDPSEFGNFPPRPPCINLNNLQNEYQFNGIIRCSYGVQGLLPTHVNFGSDGANGTIETFSEEPTGLHRLLINTGCGLDVFVGKPTAGKVIANYKLGVGTEDFGAQDEFRLAVNGSSYFAGDNPTIRLHDNSALTGEASSDNSIESANGALRIISDNGIIFFLDSDNNNGGNSSKSFRIMKNSHKDDANGKDLLLLTENGTMYIESIFIRPTNSNFRYPDYVFKKEYNLMPLDELKRFITDEGHLPGIKGEETVKKDGGYSLNELTLQLLKKQEETTLYLIALKEENERMKKELEALKNRIK